MPIPSIFDSLLVFLGGLGDVLSILSSLVSPVMDAIEAMGPAFDANGKTQENVAAIAIEVVIFKVNFCMAQL